MVIDHIGIAVQSIEEGLAHWKNVFGYEQMTRVVENRMQKVNVVFLRKAHSIDVKLIESTDTTSVIFGFTRKGGGLHHLCFKCGNLDGELERLAGLGLRVLTGPQPGEAFENERIAFVYAKQGLNIELIDTEKRRGIL
jgi:methylmalonyl-CoA/ethylmalonyl-CoA epimerase